MENKDRVIQELFSRLDELTRQQKLFQDEIYKLHQDLHKIKTSESTVPPPSEMPSSRIAPAERVERFVRTQIPQPLARDTPKPMGKEKKPWEEFIGTNLLNKAGIAVLVLGIAFGAKYSIDHQLIDPLTRIVLGYLAGFILIGIAFRLRDAHAAFSAVLLSGGMAVLYFITFAAHSFYGLIPQLPSFLLMVLFTMFTVIAAVRYNLEIIGLIGLAGAYAVPILLSDGSGRVVILFSYISIINTGILFLAFKKYWKRLYYLAFILTWLTFASWYAFSFDSSQHTAISLTFSTVFFVTFYITFLAYKLIRNETLGKWDVVCMLFNSFLFFGYGYLTVEALESGDQFLGLFALLTAVMHFVACLIIYKKQEHFNDIFYFVAGMVLVFVTIAVPVQLEGNWVTLVWAGEAALMFWIGRAKGFPAYEKLSFPLIALAFISLLHDWSHGYPSFYYYTYLPETSSSFTIFLNPQFFTSMLVGAMLFFIIRVSRKHPALKAFRMDSYMHKFISFGVPLLALIVIYVGFYKEIEAYWNFKYAASRISVPGSEGSEYNQYDHSLINLKNIWLLIYSALFAGALCLMPANWRTRMTDVACLATNTLVLLIFITSGLLELSALRSDFLDQDLAVYYNRGPGHVFIRYVAVIAMLPLLWFNRRLTKNGYLNADYGKVENLYFHLVVLVLLSSELIHWLDMARVENSFKLSLSILWGTYALFLVVFGLSRDIKHIRLGAIVLFGITLLKLFAYDMADMSTILKTVVMIVLGVLLLTASFIYNKYKRSAGNEAP